MDKIGAFAAGLLALALMGFGSDDAKRALDGQWRSAGLILTIDAQAGEATLVDAAQPIQQGRFELKRVVGRTVLFTVGDKRFVGSLKADELTVTIGNDPFTQTLRRVKGGSTSARNASAVSNSSEAAVSAQPQPSAPGAQAAVVERNTPTGPPAPAAPASAALPPSLEHVAQPAPAEMVNGVAVAKAPDPTLVDINTAPSDELDRLARRIGKAIVRGRPYKSIDELVSKRVLTRGTFGQIKDRIMVR